jgi:hybrid cluster-associated redox disulfide protein
MWYAKGMIAKDMTIEAVLRDYPFLEEVFRDHGLHCAGCLGGGIECLVGGETIADRADWYGIAVEDLLADLNRALAGRRDIGRQM